MHVERIDTASPGVTGSGFAWVADSPEEQAAMDADRAAHAAAVEARRAGPCEITLVGDEDGDVAVHCLACDTYDYVGVAQYPTIASLSVLADAHVTNRAGTG